MPTNTQDIQNGLNVLETEIDGLQQLKATINDEFAAAIDIINTMKSANQRGRLIIAGIGKSGHVARKIAATMASTGTPAYYVHPGEASHGDLGMITDSDVVLMLSNSGENAELSDLIHYTRRFRIKLIAITSNADSTLGQHSDINLLIPKAKEACPNGMAPTTSTTMMMALGDAIAVALLERMGLTKEQFKIFHPGGKLGQKLLKTSDLMVQKTDLPLATQDTKMQDIIVTMTGKNLGCVLITDGDLKRHISDENFLTKPASDIMSTNPTTIAPATLAVEAVNIMTQTPGKYLTSLIVLDDKNIHGLIRLQDCLQAGVE